MSVVEFKTPQAQPHSLVVRRKNLNCPHNAMKIHPDARTVTCDACGDEVDPIEALLIVASKIWWQESARERDLKNEQRRVEKVQYAAIAHLYAAGITPEKYAERWAREDRRVKALNSLREEHGTDGVQGDPATGDGEPHETESRENDDQDGAA